MQITKGSGVLFCLSTILFMPDAFPVAQEVFIRIIYDFMGICLLFGFVLWILLFPVKGIVLGVRKPSTNIKAKKPFSMIDIIPRFFEKAYLHTRTFNKNGDIMETLRKRLHNRHKRRKRSIYYLELYYDTTVEPFESPAFNSARVLDLLIKIQSAGFKVRIIDTAGWSREMLMEQYRSLRTPRGRKNDIFGPPKKRGWFFGREVPALVVYSAPNEPVDVYPHHEDSHIITVEDFLGRLLDTGVIQK